MNPTGSARGSSRFACGSSTLWQQRADVVVVGTGVAGLVAALAAHRRGRRVVVLSKARETATFYAQGGIAVVLPDTEDSVEAHVADTVAAGGGLCDADAVRSIVAAGYDAVADLVADGARFDEATPGQWALTREGGHTRRRIIHAGGDATGAEVQRALDRAAANLDIRRDHAALHVLRDDDTVTGVLVRNEDGVGIIHAPSVILATGGLGHVYAATTNPSGSTGDGIALALWAGVAVRDIEFVQFHPTMLYAENGGGRRPLITEALRGEGAILVDSRGDSVTDGVHPMGDLAPRDVVAAAINARLSATGDPCVYLDARGVAGFSDRFPTVAAACLAAGVDPTRQPIPVVPGAHYSCGGVVTDVCGRTELPGSSPPEKWPAPACTGGTAGIRTACSKGWSRQRDTPPQDRRHDCVDRQTLQHSMSEHASVVRDADGLQRLDTVLAEARSVQPANRQSFEDAALTVTARAIAVAALARTESRGCHHRGDHPETDPAQEHSVTIRAVAGRPTLDTPTAVC
ncbi:L-aspartate oxidase [Mycolicibacterium conceptionense]|uniref:L-aspartate oxidase n=1 Tax=Mycolicibacterium conceptionense TaxID=451644 RepID=A0A0U1DEE9_9MYCO|nr:L-aspartate oxidase [Mycolicibacterium conceptionense]